MNIRDRAAWSGGSKKDDCEAQGFNNHRSRSTRDRRAKDKGFDIQSLQFRRYWCLWLTDLMQSR